jgi:glycosyltransferase involved in cell wall biosynthesis
LPKPTIRDRALAVNRALAHRYDDVYWKQSRKVVVLDRLRHVQADVVLANDLDTLPIALSLGLPVAFDAHEYAPRQLAGKLWWQLLVAPYTTWQCRTYIPQVASMTTVAPGIADEYERLTGVRATVVTNAPPYADLEPTPVHVPIRILHHGGAHRGRGFEEMIRIADLVDERFTIDFVLVEGTPGYRDELMHRARDKPNISFPPPRPMRELPRMANDYDIGLYLLPPTNFNRRHALPNKFFEFIQGRLAVVVGPSPEMARLLRRYGCGIVADDFKPETLAAALNALDDEAIAALKRASDTAARELTAERNAELVVAAVDESLQRGLPT